MIGDGLLLQFQRVIHRLGVGQCGELGWVGLRQAAILFEISRRKVNLEFQRYTFVNSFLNF